MEKQLKTIIDQLKALTERVDKLEKSKPKKEKSASTREPSEYNKFIKKKYEEFKKDSPDLQHKEIFSKCVAAWKEHSESK